MNDTLNLDDIDQDGYSTCTFDCDDNDNTQNLDDIDQDGFSTCGYQVCYQFDLTDSYGDGWNGGYLSIFNNSIEVAQVRGYGAANTETVCIESGYEMMMSYTAGEWEEENAFVMKDELGDVLYVAGPNITEGELYATQSQFLPDCNDTNGQIHPTAQDIPNDGVDQDCDGIQ